MNEKTTTLLSKKIIPVIVLLVCAAAAILIFILFRGQDTGYRDILVFEAATDATVNRDGETIAVYEGMKLQNMDTVTVTGDGCLRLLLDEDKYVTLVSGTEILLMASGDSDDSSTEIQLISGSILNEIDSKLSPASTYEITTPASVMAVRGTAFCVSTTVDEAGMYTVDLAVFDGTVGTMASGSNTELLIGAGETAQLYGSETGSDIVFANQPIDYSTLPAEFMEIIIERKNNGDWTSLPASVDELKAALASSDTENLLAMEETDTTEEELDAATEDPDAQIDSAKASEASGAETKASETSGKKTKASETSGRKTPVAKTPVPVAASETPSNPETPTPPSGGDTTYTPPANSTEIPDKPDPSNPSATHTNDVPEQPNAVIPRMSFTVTFITADGAVFAKQTVSDGACAFCPKLIPTTGSNWYLGDAVYDFGTPVTADITLCYK